MPHFIDFVLYQLPPPPCRVLEVGCGTEGGLVPALAAAGYDALGVDPDAPEGERFVRGTFESLSPSNTLLQGWEAVVAARVLHHVRPLGEAIERLAALAPLLLVDEFAWELIDEPAQEWYERRHRELSEAGASPPGPPSLDAWRGRHADLHRQAILLGALRDSYEETALVHVPYLYRWLGDPASESVERELIDGGAFGPIGWRWAGVAR